MKGQSDVKGGGLNSRRPDMTAQESKRHQQRKETLRWISENALSALRFAWRGVDDPIVRKLK